MNYIRLSPRQIDNIAQTVYRVFADIRRGLDDYTLPDEDLAAIDSLKSGTGQRRSPVDGSVVGFIDMSPCKRLARFPEACCADAVATLGIIYTMACVDPESIVEITAEPKRENPNINFHKWLTVDGYAVDITLGQFHPLGDELDGTVVFMEHPLEKHPEYAVTAAQFVIPTPAVKFSEHFGIKYVFSEALEISRE
jgi:hypothetical protein